MKNKEEKMQNIKDNILKEYMSLQLQYVEFTLYIENEIKNALIENGIKYQSISSRVKSYDSLTNKLTDKMINVIHKDIKKLNDLSGVRVIFYDETELKRFSGIIYDKFNIVNYKISEDIMQYDGTNITISLKKTINKFKDFLCEIQLTTVLSHAMNEFGHNIIYKDIDELQAKDAKEYDKIKSIFLKVREDVYKVISSMEFINQRVKSIKMGARNLELILDDKFIDEIKSIDSLNDLESIINRMIEIIPLINENEDNCRAIYESSIIYTIVSKFSKLPHESAMLLNYDTFEYKYDKMLEFLRSYKYLWIHDFKRIIVELYEIALNNQLLNKFDDFIEKLLISDKVESEKSKSGYSIHEMIFCLILDSELDDCIKLILSKHFCNLDYHYCEEAGMNQVSFIRKRLCPNNNYINKIYEVIKVVLHIFSTNESQHNNALQSLISINYELENNSKIFKRNTIYDYFYLQYDDIDVYSKNKLYNSVGNRNNSILKKSDFYKKLKSDRLQILFAMLFGFSIIDVPSMKYNEKEEFREKYLNKYIDSFDKSRVEDILSILDIIDKDEIKQMNLYNAGIFLIRVGLIKNYGKRILKKKWNEFIMLGIIDSDANYKYKIENEQMASSLVDAMLLTSKTNIKLLDNLISFSESSHIEALEIKIMKIIINNGVLVNNAKYKCYLINKLKIYNDNENGILGEILYNFNTEKLIISLYEYEEICIILENLRFCEFNRFDEFFLSYLFEKYPDDIRMLIRKKLNDHPNTNLDNTFNYSNLTSCSNFDEERYNNIVLCFELLKQNNYYKISNYIHFLTGGYNEKIEKDIIKYLKEKNDYANYEIAIDMCRMFDVSISCWKICEHIISNIDENDQMINEIDCIMFNTGVVTGEYGIANAFNEKYLFFSGLKSKNKKVEKFVNTEKKRFKNLYQEEKNKRDKKAITAENTYNLEKGNNM